MNAVMPDYNVNELVARDLLAAFSFGDEIPRDDLDVIIERHGGFTSNNTSQRANERHVIKVEVNKIGKAEGTDIHLSPPQFFQLEYHKYKGGAPTGNAELMLYGRGDWILRDLKKKRQERASRGMHLRRHADHRLEEAKKTPNDTANLAACMAAVAQQKVLAILGEAMADAEEALLTPAAILDAGQVEQVELLGIEDMSDEVEDRK